MAFNFDLLKRLSEVPGVAGHEDEVRALVVAEMRPLVDEISVDTLGNVVGLKRGRGERRVMVAAHMDEIGFIVRHVDDKGFLRIHPVGGFDARVLQAQRVVVHTAGGQKLHGVLAPAAKPIHLLAGAELKVVKIEEFFVDLGLPGDQVKSLVEIGDMITLDRTCERVGDNIIGKALDDRAGIFALLEALRHVGAHEADILAVATVQEEVGLRGALTSAFQLEPHVGIALDVTLALDIPGHKAEEHVTRLGDGVAIGLMNSSVISNPKLARHLREIAKRDGIKHQLEIMPRGGTDAGSIQRARGGVPAITLSIPTRYVHTVNEMVSVADVEAEIRLLVKFLEEAHAGDYRL